MAKAEGPRPIESVILEFLREKGREFTADELQTALKEQSPGLEVNHWEVREAIWRLVADRLAVLTPDRAVKVP